MDSSKCGSAEVTGTWTPHGHPISGTSRCGMVDAEGAAPDAAPEALCAADADDFAGAACAWDAARADAPSASIAAAATAAHARTTANARHGSHWTLLRFGRIDESSEVAPASARAPGKLARC
jgi:hypothetical protein